MRISKKILAGVLAALMAISMMPFTALGLEGSGQDSSNTPGPNPAIPSLSTTYNVASGADLKTAVANAEDGDTIKFTADIDFTAAQVGITVDKDITFDLNGCTITSVANGALKTAAGKVEKTVVMIVTGADVVFTDSVGGGSWSYTYGGNSQAFFCDVRDNAKVTVNGGTYIANDANYGSGTFYVRASTAELVINDGTFRSVSGPRTDYSVWANSGTTTINGGTFETNNGTDISVNIQSSSSVTVNIKGGEFNAKTSAGTNSKTTVTGGIFKNYDGSVSTALANFVADDKVIDTTTGQLADVDPSTVAKIGNDQYSSLETAIAAVPASGTIKLVDDVTVASTIEITDGKKFTINLNGNDITAATRIMNIRHGNVSISGTGNVNATFSNANSAFAVYGSTNSADANYSVLTIQTYATVNSNGYGAMIGATSGAAFGAVITVYGTINSRYGLYVNGNVAQTDSANAAKVTLGTTSTAASISSSNANSVIYAAGYAKWAINNANLTGGSAIYIKSGNMTIKKGTFTANGAKTDYAFNSNGCDITGDCVIIDSCGYPGSVPTVTINGGTFTSASGAAVASYCKQDDARYTTAEFPRVAGVVPGTSTAVFSSDVSTLCEAGFKTVYDAVKEGYVVTECEDTMSITVDNNIDLNINIDTTDDRIETLEYTFSDPYSAQEGDSQTVTKAAADDSTSIKIQLSPAQIMDEITVTAKDGNGDVVREVTTSIAEYCTTIIESPTSETITEELKDLAKSTLDYGKAASQYFGYNTGASWDDNYLADPTAAINAVSYDSNEYAGGIYAMNKVSYVATSTPELRFYLMASSGHEQNLLANANADITCNIGKAKFVKDGANNFILQIKGIDITDFGKQIEVKVGDTTVVKYTPIHWVKAAIGSGNTNLENLGKGIGNYYLKSVAYFGKNA